MKRIPIALALTLALAGLAACGSTPVEPLSYDASALETPDGRVDTRDESPAFGDPVIASEQVEDRPVGAVGDAEDAAAEAAGLRLYYVAVRWGQLRWSDHPGFPRPGEASRPSGEPTVWDGTLCALSGAKLRLLRVARFEDRTDAIESATETCVTFKSQTLPHWDGLLIRLAVPGAVGPDHPVLALRTSPASIEVAAGDLDGLHRIVDTGNARHDRVALLSMRHRPCAHGRTEGRWIRLDDRGGVFQGRWVNHAGTLVGHVRGLWGARENGERVFFGKIIGREGRFIGRIKGRYGDGFFRGVFEARDGRVHGAVFGQYRGEDGRGMFGGHWLLACPDRTCQCDPGEPTASTPDARPACRCEAPQGG
jgi:hypothetical protein